MPLALPQCLQQEKCACACACVCECVRACIHTYMRMSSPEKNFLRFRTPSARKIQSSSRKLPNCSCLVVWAQRCTLAMGPRQPLLDGPMPLWRGRRWHGGPLAACTEDPGFLNGAGTGEFELLACLAQARVGDMLAAWVAVSMVHGVLRAGL